MQIPKNFLNDEANSIQVDLWMQSQQTFRFDRIAWLIR